MTISFLLYVVALVLLILAGIGVPTRVNLGWLGLACWLAAEHLIGAF